MYEQETEDAIFTSVQVCDARDDATSFFAGKQTIFIKKELCSF